MQRVALSKLGFRSDSCAMSYDPSHGYCLYCCARNNSAETGTKGFLDIPRYRTDRTFSVRNIHHAGSVCLLCTDELAICQKRSTWHFDTDATICNANIP